MNELPSFFKNMHFVFYFVAVFSICEASEFYLERSTDWQFVGRKVQFSFTMDITESTPLKVKIKLPFNGSAILRTTEAKYVFVSEHLTSSLNTTTLTSSANDGLNDIALFDLGNVTRSPSVNSTEIKIYFEVQLLNHAHIVNGGAQWVSVGAEYRNKSIWAAQLAIRTINTAVSRPDLKVDFWSNGGSTVRDGGQVKYRLHLSHSALTKEEVVSGVIELPLPPVLTLYTWRKVEVSINVELFNSSEMVTIKFGQLKFYETVALEITYYIDVHKTKADGKIHDLTTHVIVKYNGSANTCSSSSVSREFTNNGPATYSIKYYVPLGSCDKALGMVDGSIADSQITASSYATGGEPYKGKLNSLKAWIPHGPFAQVKNQYLEVNFTSKVKIRRLVTKGLGKNFVKDIFLFYSDNCVIFKQYKQGSKVKVFPANKNGDYEAAIILPVPFEAVCVRISPNAWKNSIALRVEFYGCDLNQPITPGPVTFTSRGYLLDKTSDTMYVCSVPMKSKKHSSKCFYSSDQGTSWTAIYHGVISLLGHDTVENVLYGVGMNGKSVLKSTKDHSAKFYTVPVSAWDTAKAKGTTNIAVMIGNDLVINNTTMTPLAEHTITSDSNTVWGVSAEGIHVQTASVWNLKAIWMNYDCDYIDIYICSAGYSDPSNERCMSNSASIVVNGVERAQKQIGYNVVVLSRQEGNFISSAAFNLHASSTADDELGGFIDGLSDNVIVLIAVMDEATHGGGASESNKQGADTQLAHLGATNPRPSGYRASWALVGYKGPRDQVDWIRFAEAPAEQGPTEISVQIPITKRV